MIGMTELQPAPSVSPASLAFGTACSSAIMQERAAMMAKGEVFRASDIARIVAKLDSTRLDRPTAAVPAQSRPRKATGATTTRNALFDALAAACGYPAKITRTAGKTIGVALAEIREVDPGVTPEEIAHKAGIIRRKYEKAGPMAVSAHWASVGYTPPTKSALKDPYVEPANWRDVLRKMGEDWDTQVLNELLTLEWKDMKFTIRQEILKKLS